MTEQAPDIRLQLDNLRERINYHRYRYHVLKDPEISDEEYDSLFKRLLEMERRHPDLIPADSPTGKTGPKRFFSPVAHSRPMLRPRPVFTEKELREFDSALRIRLGEDRGPEYVVEPEIPGAAVEMVYEQGRLTIASSEGDGYTGEDITLNMRTILTVPITIDRLEKGWPVPERIAVRGTVYLETDSFEKLNRGWMRRGLPPFSGPKQAAEESLVSVDPRVTARRPLNVFSNDAADIRGIEFQTLFELMTALQEWCIRVNRPMTRVCPTIEDVVAHCSEIREMRSRLPYPIAGALVRINDLALRARLDREGALNEWTLSFQFDPVSGTRTKGKKKAPPESRKNNLPEISGKIFVITGTLHALDREEAAGRIRKRGGRTSPEVTGETDYLVSGDSPGAGLQKARDLGITVISEEEFLEMV